MNEQQPLPAAGAAMLWQSFQMIGVKAIYMIRLLVLAILLTPADFGLFAIATAATGFLQPFTNLGLLPALVQAKDLDDRKYDAAWTFDVVRSIIVAALTILLAPIIAAMFAEPMAIRIIQVLALRPLLESLVSIKMAALHRDLSFRPLAFLKIVEAIFNAIVSIAFAKSYGVWSLVFGMIGGGAAMVIVSYILAPYRPHILFDWKSIQPLMKFGWWILVTGVVAMAGSFGLRIAISRQLGAEGLGLYYLAAQIAFLPSEVASVVVGTVAFPLFARLQSYLPQALRAFRAILIGLMALLYPVCALMIVLSPVLVREVLGPEWDGTASLIQILAVASMIALLSDATIPLVKGFGQPSRATQVELVQSLSLVALIWFFTTRFGVMGTALVWLPTVVLVQILCLFFIRDIFQNTLRDTAKPLIAILISTIATAAVSLLVISVLHNVVGIVLASFLAVLVTGSILWFADRHYSLGLTSNFAVAFPQVAVFLKLPSSASIELNKHG